MSCGCCVIFTIRGVEQVSPSGLFLYPKRRVGELDYFVKRINNGGFVFVIARRGI